MTEDPLGDLALDETVELMRECLRDMHRSSDPVTRAMREQCKFRMTKVAHTFTALRENKDALELKIEELEGEIKETEQEMLLLARISEMAADVERRMFTGKEFLAFIRKHTSPWFDWEWKTT